jgi:hypothetical protein
VYFPVQPVAETLVAFKSKVVCHALRSAPSYSLSA